MNPLNCETDIKFCALTGPGWSHDVMTCSNWSRDGEDKMSEYSNSPKGQEIFRMSTLFLHLLFYYFPLFSTPFMFNLLKQPMPHLIKHSSGFSNKISGLHTF